MLNFMTAKPSPSTTPTQAQRRTLYGLNVVIAIAAAVALTILLNWIVYRTAWKLDFSAGRKYTLAPQTLNFLRDMQHEHQIVTLFNETIDIQPQTTRARDLLGEYARHARGGSLRVEHIEPGFEPQRYEDFLLQLRSRFDEPLQPLREAVEQAMAVTTRVREDIAQHMAPLREVLEHPDLTDANARRHLQEVAMVFLTRQHELDQMQVAFGQAMSRTLPNYAAARLDLTQNLNTLATNVYGIAIERFERTVREPRVPGEVKEKLLRAVDAMKQTLEEMHSVTGALQRAKTVEAYDRLLSDLRQDNPIVLIGEGEVRILSLRDMFRQTLPQEDEEQFTEPAFQGEERLTGALVSMTLPTPPLIVFVTDNTLSPFGRGADAMMLFNDVAQRLRHMNFEVTYWSPAGGRSPQGQPLAPSPVPEPKEGQKAVWVVTSATPIDPRNPMAAGYRDAVASLLKERLDVGDAAMLMFGFVDGAQFGQTDPVADVIAEWGITPQLDRVLFQEVATPNRPPAPSPRFVVTRWSGDTAIGAALQGMPATFVMASPLIVGQPDLPNAQLHTLVTLQGDRIWGEQNFTTDDIGYKASHAADSFTLAAAVQSERGRIIAVGDPFFASDFCTTNADPRLNPANVGTAEYFGAAYPANAELFVNGIYWLSELDILIAAGARTQDIRRIRLQPESIVPLRWTLLAGMPLGVLAVGMSVWFARRRQ